MFIIYILELVAIGEKYVDYKEKNLPTGKHFINNIMIVFFENSVLSL